MDNSAPALLKGAGLTRRSFLEGSAAAVAGLLSAQAALPPAPSIIDSHVHFFDPTRPAGVAWPPKTDALLYKPTLPKDFQPVAKAADISGVVVIESSDWLEDNQWLLDLAAANPLIVGVVGNLAPHDSGFSAQLARFSRSPLFRGIRLPSKSLANDLDDRGFVSALSQLSDLSLSLDLHVAWNTLGPIAALAARLPRLRIILDHLPLDGTGDEPQQQADSAALRALARFPNVFAKISHLPRRDANALITDPEFYRPALDGLWDVFGEDRLIYGSNWPVCLHVASLKSGLSLVSDYFAAQTASATAKFFRVNSRRAYGWTDRL